MIECIRKKGKLIVAILSAVCLLLLAPLFLVQRPGLDAFSVHGLCINQKDFTLTASWNDDPDCNGYSVIISKGGSRSVEQVEDNHVEISDVRPGEKYKVTVIGQKKGYRVCAVTEEKTVTREKQDISITQSSTEGFHGDHLSIASKAKGNVKYVSSDSNVATVDENGTVSLDQPGKAVIKIDAEETDLYMTASEETEITVYPDVLDTPEEVTISEGTATDVTIKWNEVDFASQYRLYRKSVATDEYTLYPDGKTKKPQITIPADSGTYKVKARVKVGEEWIESELSDEVEVPSIADEMPAYKTITGLGTFDSSNVEKAVSIEPKAYTLQALCITDDRYVVLYSARSGTAGMIECYSFDGKLQESAQTGNIGHANGCAYNPATNEIYVVQTWVKKKIPRIAVFDAKTLERKDDITTMHCPTGIGYDESTDSYCLTDKLNMYVTDGVMNHVSTIGRLRYRTSQDVGAYNGLALSYVWHGGMHGSVDMYRLSDGAYVGSYDVNLGEIEGIAVKDGRFAILVNNGNDDAIYLTKDRVSFGQE